MKNTYYIIYYENNGFQAMGDWFNNINKKGPYYNIQETQQNINVYKSIIYCVESKSYINLYLDQTSINDLLKWAQLNVFI